MSYSFSVRGRTKKDVREQFTRELDQVARTQEVHKKDQSAIDQATAGFLELVNPQPGEIINMHTYGSISTDANGDVRNVSLSVQIGVSREF
jgi:hypothetical protein